MHIKSGKAVIGVLSGTLLLLGCFGVSAAAQGVSVTPTSSPGTRRFDTRQQLQVEAAAAERQGRTSEAWLLKSRLEKGDFQEGDRIVVVLESTPGTIDTLRVRAGKLLQINRLADLSLEGVLRSELTDTLRNHLSRYLTNPAVRATPLLPLAVLGSVASPGFYYTPADVVLRDVIMRAGGPRADADLDKVVVRRAGDIIWQADAVRVALSDGLSLDRLHLRAGDEIFVPERRRLQVTNILAVVSSTLALTLAVLQMSR